MENEPTSAHITIMSSRSSTDHRCAGSLPLIGTSKRIVVVTVVVAGAWLLLSMDVVSVATAMLVVNIICVTLAADEVPALGGAVVATGTAAVVEITSVAGLPVGAPVET